MYKVCHNWMYLIMQGKWLGFKKYFVALVLIYKPLNLMKMKTIKIFLLLVFAFVLLISTTVNAQKIVKKVDTDVTLPDSYGVPHTFSGDGIEVLTLNGTFLRTVHIKIPKDILELFTFDPYANIWIFGYYDVDLDRDGVDDVRVWDTKVFINKSGNMSVSFHYNGAGGILPRGY